MLNELKAMSNITTTENGAIAYGTTGSDCLDLFATIGALRLATDDEIVDRFIRAYMENPDNAMKILFFGRDIRGGLGERRVFKTILSWLANHKPESARKNIENVAEFGRFDDLLTLLGTPCEKAMLSCLKDLFENDMAALARGESVSLLGKWLPSVNASSASTRAAARKVAAAFGLSITEYRKSLSALRKQIEIIENNLREKDYTFDYKKQPSKALFKYRKAFMRNDDRRYSRFIEKVNSGKLTLNASTLTPYDVVSQILDPKNYYYANSMINPNISKEEEMALDATWKSLTDFGGDENMLAVVDGSGSMYSGPKSMPAAVAMSLGIYFAEHNKGKFHNHFITFSNTPKLIEIKGKTIVDKVSYVSTFDDVASTNLEGVFELILCAAVDNKLPQEELPSKIVIISDMEFNYSVTNASDTIFNNAKAKFAKYGYKLPEVVFWNVNSRNAQQPVTMNEMGVALVSGSSANLFDMVAKGELSPMRFMLEVINDERYAKVVA